MGAGEAPARYRVELSPHAGDYRIVYEIHDRILLVVVLDVGHRREIYRKR